MAVLSCACGSPEPAERVAADRIERYTDLLRLAVHYQTVLLGESASVEVWDLDDHYRPVLAQPAPGRTVLGPIASGEQCRAHFGLGLEVEEAGRTQAGSIRFRLLVRNESGDQPVFEESVATAGWHDREVALPDTRGEFSLVLETSGGGGRAGWSTPYVTCAVPRGPERELSHPHVLLISIDTLRADHLGVYGYPRATTPVLDALAADAVVFDDAFAPAPFTLPSHASMFTGLYPDEHGGGHATPLTPLPAGPPTIAEVLRDAGYWTIGFSAGGMMSQRYGLARGFQWWSQRVRANLAAVLPGLFDAIGTSPARPLFLVLHTYDVHGPYDYLPGRSRAGELGGESSSPGVAREDWDRVRGIGYHEYQRLERFDDLSGVVDAYDAGIRFVDEQLGRLFARLQDVGIYDDMLIIVTSDHGESLHDRGLYIGHTYGLYDEELRVPLIVRLPQAARRGRSSQLVSLVDLAPLILGVTGISPQAPLSGIDPLAISSARELADREIRGEASHTGARYARSPRWKWISRAFGPDDDRIQLPRGLRDRFVFEAQGFDVTSDPRERTDLAGQGDELPAALAGIRARLESRGRPGTGDSPGELSPEEANRLRALGYLND